MAKKLKGAAAKAKKASKKSPKAIAKAVRNSGGYGGNRGMKK